MVKIYCDLCGKRTTDEIGVTVDKGICTVGEPSTEELHFHWECYVRTKDNFYDFAEKVRKEKING